MAIIYLFLYMREMPAPENSDTGWVMRVETRSVVLNTERDHFFLFLKWLQSTLTKTPSIYFSLRADGPSVGVCVPHADIHLVLHLFIFVVSFIWIPFKDYTALCCACILGSYLSLACSLWKWMEIWMQSRQ